MNRLIRGAALLFLLHALFAAQSAAQVQTFPPQPSGGGGSFSGGTITAPILGPTGCDSTPYGFTDDVHAGMCLPAANSLRFSVANNVATSTGFATLTVTDGFFGFWDVSGTPDGLLAKDNELEFYAAGAERLTLTSSEFASTLPFLAPNGTAAAPGYAFSVTPGTGWYRDTGGQLVASVAGTGAFQIQSSGLGVKVVSTGSYQFSPSTIGVASDTNLSRVAAGFVGVTSGFQVPAGSAAAPSYAFSAASTTGFWHSGGIVATTGGVNRFHLTAAGGLRLEAALAVNWSPGDPEATAADTGLARSEAAVYRATNGSTGLGYQIGGQAVEANTGTKAPTVTESGELYTNTGDADGSTINLPNDPTIGTQYIVAATVAQDITIVPAAGETVMFGNTVCSTSFVVGGAATGIGDSVTVVAATGGSGAVWITTAFAGTPVCTP